MKALKNDKESLNREDCEKEDMPDIYEKIRKILEIILLILGIILIITSLPTKGAPFDALRLIIGFALSYIGYKGIRI